MRFIRGMSVVVYNVAGYKERLIGRGEEKLRMYSLEQHDA